MTPAARAKLPDLKGSIFIITYGRSGSTLLQSLLQTIPRAHIAGENYGALYPMFQASLRIGKSKRTWGKKDHGANHPWFMADKLQPKRFANLLADMFVQEVLRPPRDARWIGFKEIRYASMEDQFEPFLDFLRARFPNTHLVFNSRDVDKVAQSKWWGERPEAQVAAMVRDMDARFAAYTVAHPDCSYHAVHERTVADPMSLSPLFEQFGETLDPKAAEQVLSVPLTH